MPDNKNVIDELVVETSIDANQKSFDTAISNFNQVRSRAASAASSGVSVLDAALSRVGVTAKSAKQQLGGFTRSGATMLSNFSGFIQTPAAAPWRQKPEPAGKPKPDPAKAPAGMTKLGGAVAGMLTAGAFKKIISQADSIAKMSKAFDIDARELQGLAHLHASYGGTDVEGFNLGTQLQAMQNAMSMGVLPSNLQAAQTFAASKGYDKNLIDVFDDKDLGRVDLISSLAKAFEGIKPFDQQQMLNMLGVQGVGQRNILQQGQAAFGKELEHSKEFSIRQSALDSSENTAQFMSDMQTRARNFAVELTASSIESFKEFNPSYSFEKRNRIIDEMRESQTGLFAPQEPTVNRPRTNMSQKVRMAPAPFASAGMGSGNYMPAPFGASAGSGKFKPAPTQPPITININQTNNGAQNADEVAQKTGALTQRALERVLQNYKGGSQ